MDTNENITSSAKLITQLSSLPQCNRVFKLLWFTASLLRRTEVTEPWEMLGLDLKGPLPQLPRKNTQLLVVVLLNNAAASTVSECLLKDIFTHWGILKHILSDRGPQYCVIVGEWSINSQLSTIPRLTCLSASIIYYIFYTMKRMIASYILEKIIFLFRLLSSLFQRWQRRQTPLSQFQLTKWVASHWQTFYIQPLTTTYFFLRSW